jgi:glutathione peroxidase
MPKGTSVALLLPALLAAATPEPRAMSFFDFTVNNLQGQQQPLATYKGKVVLVVNVASECGYTPQYAGLQKLQDRYQGKGLVVLGFPCNQFGGQEPGGAAEIQAGSTKFHASFPLFEKVAVKGAGKAPVYVFLTAQHPEPKWNFTKYLVGRDGQVLQSFPSAVDPGGPELKTAIEKALGAAK